MVKYGSLPFLQQIEFFRNKNLVPTERWNDLTREMHDTGFMVAGAMKADLLADLKKMIGKSIEAGTTLAEFRNDFDAVVAHHGWTGWTGEHSKAGRAWRTKIIYDTNLRTSYQAGRWQQVQKVKKTRPYLIYKHSDSVLSPREEHVKWHNLVVHQDDPWVKTHWPPNGFGCKCKMFSLSKRDLEKMGKSSPDTPPDDGVKEWTDPKTGEVITTPEGIQPYWDYTPGASLLNRASAHVQKKLPGLPKDIAKSLAKTHDLEMPAFVPAKSLVDAKKYAIEADLSDNADYQGLKLDVANAINEAIFHAVNDFPELRSNFKFIGTTQQRNIFWYNHHIKSMVEKYRKLNPGLSEEKLLQLAKTRVKKLKVNGRAYAVATDDDIVAGITINKKFGKSVTEFNDSLKKDVHSKWHPEGCDTIKSVIDHEIGHQLDFLLNLESNSEIILLFRSSASLVSSYAEKNIQEFIAECWAEFKNNPSPRKTAKQIGEIVLNEYKQFK